MFIQLELKLFSFNKKISIELLYLKFPDIPNVYSFERSAHRPGLLGCVVKMASDEDRLTQIVRECVRNEMALNDRDQQVILPFCLEYEILFQMRPDRQAGKRQVLPFRQWKLRSKPNFQLSILVCFRLRERGRQVHGITHGPLRKTKART